MTWRRKWQPTPVFLPGESHGQRSLADCSLWGHKGQTQLSNRTTTTQIRTGEGNGNPLQCSCLENPMDRGAWRGAVHAVTESWTGLSD